MINPVDPVVAGESDAVIAERLYMSLRTVKQHIRSCVIKPASAIAQSWLSGTEKAAL